MYLHSVALLKHWLQYEVLRSWICCVFLLYKPLPAWHHTLMAVKGGGKGGSDIKDPQRCQMGPQLPPHFVI